MTSNIQDLSKTTATSFAVADKVIESNFNAAFAKLLRDMHPGRSETDCISVVCTKLIEDNSTERPDILVRHSGGVPVAIETGFCPADNVEADACRHTGLKLSSVNDRIELSIAIKFPTSLAHAKQNEIASEILNSDFEYCIYSLKKEELEYPLRWPEAGWITGKIDDIVDLIELSTLSETIFNTGLNILEQKISRASDILRQTYVSNPAVLEKIAESLNQKDSQQTTRMAMAIILNAMTFHKSLIGLEGVKTFEEIWNPVDENMYDKSRLFEHWTFIVREINYLPIFNIALKILEPLESENCTEIIRELCEAANCMEELGATNRHDFCGRMFQRLITDRKFLATFYTLPSSAALLAEIAIERLELDWSNIEEIRSLKIADFACGTGALLNASLHSALSRHNKVGRDGKKLHKHMVEDVLIGTDIMPAATHLTASMIAGVYPDNKFEHTSIYTLPYGEHLDGAGIRNVSLGALDLLDDAPVLPIFDTGGRKLATLEGTESKADVSYEISDHSCDLVIMNPPFTRPTKHDGSNSEIPVPSFAGLEKSDDEQKLMSRRLKKLMTPDMTGHGNAGLASNFFDIAHKKVKPNGIIALVLPSTALQGGSWSKVRQCLKTCYSDISIFSIASTGNTKRAFSADTSLAEVLIVATRKKSDESQPVKIVNLVRRPSSIFEAVIVAKKLNREPEVTKVMLGEELVANISTLDFSQIGCAGTLHVYPTLTARELKHSKLMLPHLEKPLTIPITTLGSIARVGLLHRDITGKEKNRNGSFRGPFKKVPIQANSPPIYPMLWKHDALSEKKLTVAPDSEGEVRENCDENAKTVWNETKSRLHYNLDFGLASQPLAACITEFETIGGRAWPNIILTEESWEIPLLLWANSTLGLISFWWQGGRQQLGRVILTNSLLPNLPVIDVRKLNSQQIDYAAEIFERLKDEEFLPASEAWRDPTRLLLDQLLLTELLGLSWKIVREKLNVLRNQWCQEPTVHAEP